MNPLTKFTDKDRELYPRRSVVGEELVYELDGTWYSAETNSPVELEIKSLNELMTDYLSELKK